METPDSYATKADLTMKSLSDKFGTLIRVHPRLFDSILFRPNSTASLYLIACDRSQGFVVQTPYSP
jgi:hypothetical protein